MAQYVSYRDAHSREIAESLGILREQYIYPDLAFSLDVPRNNQARRREKRQRSVGVSPIAYRDPRSWPVKDAAGYQRYVVTMASFVERLVAHGWTVVFFASQTRFDSPVIEDVNHLLMNNYPSLDWSKLRKVQANNIGELLDLLSGLELVVASRFHGVLFANLVSIPVLAISYEKKVDALMADLGLERFCLPIQKLEPGTWMEQFVALEKEASEVRVQIRARVEKYREQLEEQYKRAFWGR
jgi:polysaccharide pyruvyl transferase WcaK-like protein